MFRKTVISLLFLALVFLAANGAYARPYAYITNYYSHDLAVVDTESNTIFTTIAVGTNPMGVAVTPDGSKVYVANYGSDNISVIDTHTNTVITNIELGVPPYGLAVSPDGSRIYVTNIDTDGVYVIDTAANTVIAVVGVGSCPRGVAVTPDGTKAYVTKVSCQAISVIDTASNTVITDIWIGNNPFGIAISPDGARAYVASIDTDSLSVIDTATNTVIATVGVGVNPRGVAVSPCGSKVYVANMSSHDITVIDAFTNTAIGTFGAGGSCPWGIATTPDGLSIYTSNICSDDISIIDASTYAVTAKVAVGYGPVAFGKFIGPHPLTGIVTADIEPDVVNVRLKQHVSVPKAEELTFSAVIEPRAGFTTEDLDLNTITLSANGIFLAKAESPLVVGSVVEVLFRLCNVDLSTLVGLEVLECKVVPEGVEVKAGSLPEFPLDLVELTVSGYVKDQGHFRTIVPVCVMSE